MDAWTLLPLLFIPRPLLFVIILIGLIVIGFFVMRKLFQFAFYAGILLVVLLVIRALTG